MYQPTEPKLLGSIEQATAELGFDMLSDRDTGALLRGLARSRPACRILEIGVGTGVGACWLLDGADAGARYLGIDNDPVPFEVACKHHQGDPRVELRLGDGNQILPELGREGRRFDLVFADSWPGKYRLLDQAVELVAPSGFFLIDDMLPQPNWPDGHEEKVERLLAEMASRPDVVTVPMAWSTGLVLAVKL